MDSELDLKLAALDLPEGALLIVSLDRDINPERANAVVRQIGRALERAEKRNQAILLTNGVTLESLNDEQLAHIGLMRIPTDGKQATQG